MYVLHVCFVPMGAGRRLQILWHWCYGWLWNMKVLKNKPGSSQRTSALSCQVIFPALVSYLVRTIFVLLILIYYVCFACMYVYALHACLEPAKLDKGIGSPGIGGASGHFLWKMLVSVCLYIALDTCYPQLSLLQDAFSHWLFCEADSVLQRKQFWVIEQNALNHDAWALICSQSNVGQCCSAFLLQVLLYL